MLFHKIHIFYEILWNFKKNCAMQIHKKGKSGDVLAIITGARVEFSAVTKRSSK